MAIIEIKFDDSAPPSQDENVSIKVDGKEIREDVAEIFLYSNVNMLLPLFFRMGQTSNGEEFDLLIRGVKQLMAQDFFMPKGRLPDIHLRGNTI